MPCKYCGDYSWDQLCNNAECQRQARGQAAFFGSSRAFPQAHSSASASHGTRDANASGEYLSFDEEDPSYDGGAYGRAAQPAQAQTLSAAGGGVHVKAPNPEKRQQLLRQQMTQANRESRRPLTSSGGGPGALGCRWEA
uniref:Uncharacterized protein n=1 Tax=Chromera velia CCMP2878 TaxID=1169474 RepID=A0A0G4FCH7_9ALVE|eukprot:Cvel_16320.t1-p1 / transcript=Cvel_16320.t1 / gene=Cvel_16320 / organism=Chromera_velia_CCMP2878 / gene_product=hypothetical protein / transcript_product=hypothetical protein / location=Cvel_scaffold1252:33654-34308(+) / protein_length=138 / sequence_SO=supercontig / SO=protein_coding / is_pseudo=false